MNNKDYNIFRRDFLKGLAAVPFLGWFALGFRENIAREISGKSRDYEGRLGIGRLKAPREKLLPPTGKTGNRLRFGLVGHGWRGEELLKRFGYYQPEYLERNTVNGKLTEGFLNKELREDLNVELTGICDTFDLHAERGSECIPLREAIPANGNYKPGAIKIFPTCREMITSGEIDMIVIATPDHTHAEMAIEAAKAGKHVYLEKPMTRTIEEAIALRDTVKSTGIVFQLGHENRQQMSYKIACEMYQKGVFGDVSMVETSTNRNSRGGAWIRKRKFDHLGNIENINWKEFLGNAPWHEFDPKRYFNWQRYSDYGTSVTGNQFSHVYDCVNQVLDLGIPEMVVALGGQYYYKDHGDMPDVLNAVFSYPERGLTLTYDCTLKSGVYRQSRIMGSEATMDLDKAIMLYKDGNSQRFREIEIESSDPLYYYASGVDVDAISTATSQEYIKGGYGPTSVEGKLMDTTFLHIKEWTDAVRGQGNPSCDVDKGFEEAVTFNLANLAYDYKKPVRWDKVNEKVIIG